MTRGNELVIRRSERSLTQMDREASDPDCFFFAFPGKFPIFLSPIKCSQVLCLQTIRSKIFTAPTPLPLAPPIVGAASSFLNLAKRQTRDGRDLVAEPINLYTPSFLPPTSTIKLLPYS